MTLCNFITSCDLWLRLAMLIMGPLRQALLLVLHSHGVPKTPVNLYNFLSTPVHKRKMSQLKGRVITQSQWDILYPPGQTETNCDLFDITLIVFLIETCTSIEPINGNWRDKNPPITDSSIGAFCIRAREMRNFLNHFADIAALAYPEFSNKWSETVIILNGLNYNGSFNLTDLKTGSLDPTNNLVMQSIVWRMEIDHKQEQQKLANKQARDMNSVTQEQQKLANKQARDMNSVTQEQQKLANKQARDIDSVTQEQQKLANKQARDMNSVTQEQQNLANKQARDMNSVTQEQQKLADKQVRDIDSVTQEQQNLANKQARDMNSVTQEQQKLAENLQIQTNNLEIIKKQLYTESNVNVSTMKRVENIYEMQRNIIASVQSDVAKMSCDLTDLTERTNTLENNIKEKNIDPDELTCRDALVIVGKMIGNNWETLSQRLHSHYFSAVDESNEARMKHCYDLTKMKIPWINLKYELHQLDRVDIVEEIKKNTLLTYGLERKSVELKQHHRDKLEKWTIPAAFKDETGRKYPPADDRKNLYVDLLVGEWGKAHVSDREHFLRTYQASRSPIEMKDIVQEDDRVVLIRGIAGIGKTSFIDQLVLTWAKEEILTNYHFVFKYTCRELNKLRNNTSCEDLITANFLKAYKGISTDLNDISSKVLLVIDGIDEYRELTELVNFSKPTNTELTAALYNILAPGSLVLPNKKIIICGRPQSCDSILNVLAEHHKKKLIEISGFNYQSIDKYIDRYFVDNFDKSSKLKMSLREIDNLQAMAHIPVYLYIICNVFASEEKLEELNTTTKLYIAACLVFLRDHMPEFKGENVSLQKLCENKQLMEVIYTTAKFAYESLIKKKILFNEKEFQGIKCSKAIESSGMIERHDGGEDGDVYQFKHLVLQEFLSAIHMFSRSKEVTSLFENESLRNCLPLVAGLHGILGKWYRGPNFIKTFTDYLQKARSRKYAECLFKKLVKDRDLFLAGYYEYQGSVGTIIETDIMPKLNNIAVSHHHTLKYVVHYLKTSHTHCVSNLEIAMQDGRLQTGEFCALSTILSSLRCLMIESAKDISADGLSILSQAIQYKGTVERGLKHGATNEQRTIRVEAINSSVKSNAHINNSTFSKLGIIFSKLDDAHIIKLSKCISHLEVLNLHGIKSMTAVSMECISKSITEASELSKNKLKKLDLLSCQLSDNQIMKLSKCIPCLEILDLSFNKNMTPISMEYISNSIIEAGKLNENVLKELQLNCCNLDDDHIMRLMKCIPRLEILDLSSNESMTAVSMECISKSIVEANELSKNKLKKLDLLSCQLSDNQIVKLSKCIPCLEILDLSFNENMTPISMLFISNSIIEASKLNENQLKKLKLRDCKLYDVHIKKLSKCISHLEVLNLHEIKNMTAVSMECISKSITEANELNENQLKELDLRSCELYDDHIKKLSKCIPCLEILDLSSNKNMTPISMERISNSIIEASKVNENQLKRLNLRWCELYDDHIKKLSKCISHLEILDLYQGLKM